jgi:hypothetical protein
MALIKSKKPWLVKGVPWKTESSFWVWVRGGLRKLWSKHPVKIEYIKSNRKRIVNLNERSKKAHPTVWGMTCEICGKDHLQSNIEIDHVGDNATFTGLQDTENYVEHLYLIDFDSLRALCKPCHKIVSYAQNTGMSFEQAAVAKQAIETMKLPVAKVLAILKKAGYTDVSNAAKRKSALIEMYTKQAEQSNQGEQHGI